MNIPFIIALSILCVFIILIMRRGAQGVWRLSEFVYDDDEEVKNNDNVKLYESVFRNEANRLRFPRGHIVITNKRIICSQKELFTKDSYRITHVINYSNKGPGLSTSDLMGVKWLQGNTNNNFLTLYSSPENIHISTYKSKSVVEIMVHSDHNNPLLNKQPLIRIYSTHTSIYPSQT